MFNGDVNQLSITFLELEHDDIFPVMFSIMHDVSLDINLISRCYLMWAETDVHSLGRASEQGLTRVFVERTGRAFHGIYYY